MTFTPQSIQQLNKGNTKVVPVIASFDPSGNIRPIYVRIQGETCHIVSSWSQEYGPLTVFHCTLNIDNTNLKAEIALTYHSRETCWTYSPG